MLNDAGTIKIDANGSVIYASLTAASVTAVSISGLAGNDTLKLDSSLGAVVLGTILGGDDNDLLISGLGRDLLNGGLGIDEISYIQTGSREFASLAIANAQNTSGAGIVTIVGIENLTGSNFNDTLNGGAGYEILSGGLGDDTLVGGLGADILNGGDGADSLYFDNFDTSVVGGWVGGIETRLSYSGQPGP